MTMLMHSIGDFERISDHAINLVDAAREMQKKEQTFSSKALEELETFSRAVSDIVDMSVNIFEKEDVEDAKHVEPFEEAIDEETSFKASAQGQVYSGAWFCII